MATTPDATEALAKLDIQDNAPAAEEAAAPAAPASPVEPAAQPTEAASPSSPAPAQSASSTSSGSLYVGELDLTVTEAMLYEIFSSLGPVSSIRVCRDAVTRRSLGYAYVNFLNAPDADRALDLLNYSLIKNKPCRIMMSQRDPALRKTGTGNIFLKNLDETIDNKALHDTFAAFGDILSCKVQLDEHGNSKGYGFVHFTTNEAADAAIQAVNGMLLGEKIVYVGHHVPKRERQAKIDEYRSRFTNLYVKNLAPEVDQKEFEELFARFGTVTSAALQVDAEGKSKGFGFVNFENHEDARRAVEELHDKEHKGLALFVSRAQKKSEREEELRKSYEQQKYEKTVKYQGVNLYVKNLEDDVDTEKLNAEFSPFGTITSCKIMTDDKGVSKGFGFVCFSSPDEATKAVTELNGKMIGAKPLYVSLAQPKEVRQQQLAAQSAQREQIRNQQLAASGMAPALPGGYPVPASMYYPGGPGAPFPPGAGRGQMMGYPPQQIPQQRGYPPRGGMPGMPPMPGYPQPYPQYPQPGGRGVPLPPNGPGRYPPQAQQNLTGPMRGAPQNLGPSQPGARPGQAGPRTGPGYKGNQTARAPEPAGPVITAAALASAGPAEQKQMLGEALYPRINDSVPKLAGKITGMLLEMDNAELLHLLENEEALNGKVSEAIKVLEDYNKPAAAAAPVKAEAEA